MTSHARTPAAGSSDPGSPVASQGPETTVLEASDVARIVDRMAHQIIESVARTSTPERGFDAVLLGIPTRGVPLAQRLAERIRVFSGAELPVGSLDITMYRDDLRLRGVRPLGETVEPDGGVTGKTVILVDDVCYSGRSTRAALDAVADLGRPRAVQLAVLVDRGHRELPIRADYVGKNIPTSPSQTVRVRLAEVDGTDSVHVFEKEDGS